MPAPALAKMADQADISMDRAEELWKKAKDIVAKEYKFSKKNPKYWALVMGIVKKMMKLKENLSFGEYLEAEKLALLGEEVVHAHFGKDTLGMKMPSGYVEFVAKKKGEKAGVLIGIRSDESDKEIKVFPDLAMAQKLAHEFNDALKAAKQKPEKISMMQAFGSHAMNVLYDVGIHFLEKPDYWESLGEPQGKYKPLHDVTLKKAEKELEKIDIKLKTYHSKDIWGGDPKGPLVSPKNMPPEQAFIVKMDNGKRYLVDKTGARSYIRMWALIK